MTARSVSPRRRVLQPDLEGVQLQVSAYERAASLIVALLLMVGLLVGMLLVIVMTRRLTTRPVPVPVQVLEEFSGRGDHPIGTEMDMNEPGVEEFTELSEPSFDQLIQNLEGLLAQENPSINTEGLESNSGDGRGDRRDAGPLGTSDVIPRADRWDIAYDSTTLELYAAQLDYFNIELGVIGGGSKGVDYVSGFAKKPRQRRHADGSADEQRLYFTWRTGQLQQFDRQLAQRAGLSVAGRRILQFYPADVENQLAVLEQAALNGRPLKTVRKTHFGVQPKGDSYEFYVKRIEARDSW